MYISDLLQSGRYLLCILKSGQKDQTVDLAYFSVLFIDRTDLAGDDKTRDHLMGDPLLPDPVLIFEYIESILRRLQFLLKFLPPGRVGKIPVPTMWIPFLLAQRSRCSGIQSPARRPGVTGMDM